MTTSAAVRKELDVGAGAISIHPDDVAELDAELFVQSSSPNRKLAGHDVLFRVQAGSAARGIAGGVSTSASPVPVPAPAPAKSKSRRSKKKAASPAPAPAPAAQSQQAQVHADFARYTPNPSETLKSLATRVGIDYTKGCGFYLLVKKEKISAKKDMVLLR